MGIKLRLILILFTFFSLPIMTAEAKETQQLAFIRDGDIYQFNVETGEETRLTDGANASGFAWSPNGLYLSIITGEYQESHLQIFDMMTEEMYPILLESNMEVTYSRLLAGDPVWSPNGQYLAFISREEVNQRLNIFDAKARAPHPIEVMPETVVGLSFDTLWWSSDSRYLAYTSSYYVPPDFKTLHAAVYVTDPIGAEKPRRAISSSRYHRFYFWIPHSLQAVIGPAHECDSYYYVVDLKSNEKRCAKFSFGVEFRLSPDGQHIARIRDGIWNDLHDVYLTSVILIDLKTGEEQSLISSPFDKESPSFSPDGRWLSFREKTRFSGHDLVLIDLRTAGSGWGYTDAKLFGAEVQLGGWSPDSSHLAYVVSYNAGQDIYVVNPQDRQPQLISTETRSYVCCVWSPDSHWLAYASDAGEISLINLVTGSTHQLTDTEVVTICFSMDWRPSSGYSTPCRYPSVPVG